MIYLILHHSIEYLSYIMIFKFVIEMIEISYKMKILLFLIEVIVLDMISNQSCLILSIFNNPIMLLYNLMKIYKIVIAND